jgi:GMP synthase-like glutamine amidotransferase
MRIGILMTNTDESAFAAAHPGDGEKWRARLAPLCPDCDFPVYAVKDGRFPDHVGSHDGFIITGSPASVNDLAPWLDRLFGLIREAVAAGVPLFGACFGHQAIALALGGAVEDNPGGWVFGSTTTEVTAPAPWMEAGAVRQYAAHVEQVTRLPEGAKVVMGNEDCPVGGVVIGRRVFTTQYHPEMTHAFVTALIAEYAGKLPAGVARTAQASLAERADNDTFARWIMDFFRQARG